MRNRRQASRARRSAAVWGITMLRDYQQRAVEAIIATARTGQHALCSMPTGSGKSWVIAELCRVARGRVLVLAHVRELLEQNADKIAKLTDKEIGLYCAGLGEKDASKPITVASVQSLVRANVEPFSAIIVDECFPPGTMIDTPMGKRPIQSLSVGDSVYSYNHKTGGVEEKEVLKTFETAHKDDLYVVRHSLGGIVCTGGHPIFTQRGYIPAAHLTSGDCVLLLDSVDAQSTTKGNTHDYKEKREADKVPVHGGVLHLWKDRNASILQHTQNSKKIGPVLLLRKVWKHWVSQVFIRQLGTQRKNEKEQPDAQSGNKGKGFAFSAKNKPPACVQGRERNRANKTAGGTRSRPWVGDGSCNSNEKKKVAWISDVLQGRCWKCRTKGCHRDRRKKPLFAQNADEGQEKGRPIDWSRVEGVEIHQRGSGCRHFLLPKENLVYNLHVEGNNNYFADGALVHNCHRIPKSKAGQYHAVFSKSPFALIIGLTATPYRLDGGLLTKGEDRLFDSLVYEAKPGELISTGWLSPIVSYRGAAEANLDGVHTRQGEFVAAEVEERFTDIAEDTCRDIVAKSQGRKAVLVFCAGIKHARLIRSTLESMGEAVAYVDGGTPMAERDEELARFASGAARLLVNVDVLTTGYDYPGIDCIAILRATKSAGLYEQMVGRGLRLADGKANCMLLDYGGNIRRHGPIGAVEIAEGKKKGKRLSKTCQSCGAENPLHVRKCEVCLAEFPVQERDLRHFRHAADLDPMARIMERWGVQRVSYARHAKAGKPDSLRVDYYCGFGRRAFEWVCIEHGGFAAQKAERWMARRGAIFHTVTEALAGSGQFIEPKEIVVEKDGRFWKVVECAF